MRNLKFLYGSKRTALTANWAKASSSDLDLAGHLLQVDDDELRGLERRETHPHVHDAAIAIVLGRGLGVAANEVRVSRLRPLERALPEERVHEGADVEADLRPKRLVVWLEDDPLQPAIEAFLDEERGAPDRNVLVLGLELIVAGHGPGAPVHDAIGEHADGVDRLRVQDAVL